MPDLSILQRNLRHFSNSSRALLCRRFFKTQPGQYGEGDEFLGISVPQVRSIAKKHRQASPKDIDILIMSPYHEERLLGLIILVSQFQSATDDKDKKRILLNIANAFGGTFAKPHKPTLKPSFAKEPPSQRTTTTRQTKQRLKEGQLITRVWRNGGRSASYESFC